MPFELPGFRSLPPLPEQPDVIDEVLTGLATSSLHSDRDDLGSSCADLAASMEASVALFEAVALSLTLADVVVRCGE